METPVVTTVVLSDANKLNLAPARVPPLVDDLVNSNQLVTKFNKFMAKNTLKKLKSKNMLVNWRDVYVRIQESR